MKATEQLLDLKGQLQYVNNVLAGDLQQWERKEYSALKMNYENEIMQIEKYIEDNKCFFETEEKAISEIKEYIYDLEEYFKPNKKN